jgi:hypothetical protein
MSIDFERRMTYQAAGEAYHRPVQDRKFCLICRSWSKPCASCAKAGGAARVCDSPMRDLDDLLRQARLTNGLSARRAPAA